MAGNVLLIRKPSANKDQFELLSSRAQLIIQDYFSSYFKEITFHRPDPNTWLAVFHKNSENKFRSSRDGWMVYEGMVFQLNETKVHNIESLWIAYKNAKTIDEFANGLDGHFVIKLYDAKKNKFYILNDFIKDKNHYYSESDKYICYTCFAQLSALIRKPTPDLYAINEFLWRYYILTERTHLVGTQRMMPASIHTISDGISSYDHYWRWPTTYNNEPFEDQVETIIESFRETVRLIDTNFKPTLDFTQGQDSRQNVAAFLNQGVNFTTSIFGKSDFKEVKAMSAITNKYGIQHHNIILDENYTQNPLKYFDRAILLGSAEEPGHLLGRIMYMREKQSAYGNLICNGMEGHFYKNGLWDEMYTFNFYREPKSFSADMFLDLRLLSQDYDDSLLSQDLVKVKRDSRDYFREMIKRSILGMEDAPVSIQVDRFDLTYWLNFQFASNSGSNILTNTCSPLLFRRNLRHALQVPVKWKFNLSRYQRAIVHQLHPELAAEKTDFGGVNMTPKNALTYLPFIAKYGWHQSQRLRNKFQRKLGFHPKTHLQEAWDYAPIYQKLLMQLKENNRIKSSNMSIQGLLESNKWDKHLEMIQSQSKFQLNDYEYVFKIISLDSFFKLANEINKRIN
jgi:hypothetical protein